MDNQQNHQKTDLLFLSWDRNDTEEKKKKTMGIREQKLSWEQEFSARKRLQLVMILGDSSRINMKQKLNSQIQHSVGSGTKKLKTR